MYSGACGVPKASDPLELGGLHVVVNNPVSMSETEFRSSAPKQLFSQSIMETYEYCLPNCLIILPSQGHLLNGDV